jgi:hypothetical protein
MFEYLLKRNLFLSPDDKGTEDKGSDDGQDDDASSDGEEISEVEMENARRAFNQRKGNREKNVKVLETKLSDYQKTVEEKLSSLTEKLNQLLEDNDTKKGGRPKNDDTKVNEMIQGLYTAIDGLKTNVTEKFSKIETNMAERDKLSQRRQDLAELGASPEFIRYVEKGVVNIPDSIMGDFDEARTLIGKLGGIPDVSNGKDTKTVDTKKGTRKSVPHSKAGLDTNAIHADKDTTVGVEEALDTALDEIDKILSKDGPLDKNDLTKAFKLQEKADDILIGG